MKSLSEASAVAEIKKRRAHAKAIMGPSGIAVGRFPWADKPAGGYIHRSKELEAQPT